MILSWIRVRQLALAVGLSAVLSACAILEEDTPIVVAGAGSRAVPAERGVNPGEPAPPVAQRRSSILIAPHGASREDLYFWLAKRKEADVLRHLQAENAYADAMMQKTAALQTVLREEIKRRIPVSEETPPFKENGYWWAERFAPGADYPTLARRKDQPGANEELVADFNAIAASHQQFNLRHWASSPDGRLFAYAVDHEGDRLHTIYFKDLTNGQMLPEKIKFVASDFAFSNDGKTIFYLKLQRGTLRSAQVFRHVIGLDPKEDKEVFSENDERFDLSLKRSKGGKYIIVTADQTLTTEVRLIDANQPDLPPVVVRPRETGTKYYVDEVSGSLFIRTNKGAPDYRIVKASAAQPGQWRDVVPHTPGTFIEGFTVTSKFIAVDEHVGGAARIRVGSFKTGKEKIIALDETGGYAAFSDSWRFPEVRNTDADSGVLRYAYSSFATPTVIYDFDVATAKKTAVKRTILPEYNIQNYTVERTFATAPDGQQVPITFAYRRDLKKPQGNPILIRGYGAYGISYDGVFHERIASLLDRGFVYAHAHVRGGREMGQAWYDQGRLKNKKNTFTDFIAAAEHLAKTGVAERGRIFAEGRSAGGLLIGAVVNMRPDLFRGVIAGVPFVDVVTTMLDSSLPLTAFEFDEWGNPEEEPEYKFMLTYSPYDNIEKKDYPAMLVTAGFNDTQVGYQEPAKWVAKLRTMKTDRNPLLFKINMGAGHSGDSGRYGEVADQAYALAFLIDLAERPLPEVTPPAPKPMSEAPRAPVAVAGQ